MIDGIRFKVCGLTSLVDAEFADRLGADFLGFILHSSSPRHLSLLSYKAMSERLPEGRKRVAVMVEPSDPELQAVLEAGFDLFQIHFRAETPLRIVEGWSQRVSPARLWLAPKLPPDTPLDPAWLPLAATFLVDTYQLSGFGGSGKTGDWPKFAELREAYPQRTWILAGGLNPENIGEALHASGAKIVDVNSGVEAAPGVKDHAKLRAFVLAIHRARTESPSARAES